VFQDQTVHVQIKDLNQSHQEKDQGLPVASFWHIVEEASWEARPNESTVIMKRRETCQDILEN